METLPEHTEFVYTTSRDSPSTGIRWINRKSTILINAEPPTNVINVRCLTRQDVREDGYRDGDRGHR